MFDYDLLSEKFVSTNLNQLSVDITKDKIKSVVYKDDNNNNVYVLTEKGTLLTLLYNKTENIMGWF
jgi:predicted transcriptional regulator